jgi:hypothetical protein
VSSLELIRRVKEQETRIWTPEGNVGADIIRAKRAVEEYDENLTLGRHALTGDWCIWLKRGPDEPPYPVIGLGPDLPDASTLQGRLRAADTRIHGDSILTNMRKNNEALEKESKRAYDEATGIAAEAYEWAHRDIKGYSGRTANVKGHKRDFKQKGT